MKITRFYISKDTAMSLMDDWFDEISFLKIEILRVGQDEFLVYYYEYDKDDG